MSACCIIDLELPVSATNRERVWSNITNLKGHCLANKIEYAIERHTEFLAAPENRYGNSALRIKLSGDASCVKILHDFIEANK